MLLSRALTPSDRNELCAGRRIMPVGSWIDAGVDCESGLTGDDQGCAVHAHQILMKSVIVRVIDSREDPMQSAISPCVRKKGMCVLCSVWRPSRHHSSNRLASLARTEVVSPRMRNLSLMRRQRRLSSRAMYLTRRVAQEEVEKSCRRRNAILQG